MVDLGRKKKKGGGGGGGKGGIGVRGRGSEAVITSFLFKLCMYILSHFFFSPYSSFFARMTGDVFFH